MSCTVVGKQHHLTIKLLRGYLQWELFGFRKSLIICGLNLPALHIKVHLPNSNKVKQNKSWRLMQNIQNTAKHFNQFHIKSA